MLQKIGMKSPSLIADYEKKGKSSSMRPGGTDTEGGAIGSLLWTEEN